MLDQIGQKLKSAREGKGLSLRQIYERTRIPMGHLLSIENAQIDDLPEPVYIAGYIKRYAECVGLNGQSLADEFRQIEESANPSKHHGGGNGKGPIHVNHEYLNKGRADKVPPTFRSFYFSLFCVVVIIGLFCYVSSQFNRQVNQVDPSLIRLGNTSSQINIQAEKEVPTTGTETQTPVEASDAHIVLSANQHVWVEVKSETNGQNLYTGFMEQGEKKDFQDDKGLRVHVGNGGSLTVDYQGKIEALGKTGTPIERTFMAAIAQAPVASTPTDTKTNTTDAKSISSAAIKKTKKSDRISEAKQYRHMEDLPSRQYLPGESLGRNRSIDVPYRFNQ